jgi:hypothetical protein
VETCDAFGEVEGEVDNAGEIDETGFWARRERRRALISMRLEDVEIAGER